ncbi:hypothetical protein MTQ01_09325 [Streptomyces sp. XM4193]|uniref:hypothetical protein n=1 Tax=Streptomyces sp. XM4193 TaxID=2929782 RepID=UPI001FFB0BE0|nr:hypothetical protein [Streptomyces sp. XM4193]MCK1796198.1 hypothetical protein [Streptomyces sp. XM4193]
MRATRASSVMGAVALAATLGATLLVPGASARAAPEPVTQPNTSAQGCDPIDPAACLLPFPSNWHTRKDSSTDTGRRVDFDPASMPRNVRGTAIDPTEWNRSDGFSPGSMLLARVPGLDLERTGAAPITDIGSSLEEDAPIVLLDLTTGERWPYWAELDANAPDPNRQALIVRPARNLIAGHDYAVALRDLKDADGKPIEAPAAFADLRAGKHDGGAESADRAALRERARQLAPAFEGLEKAGVKTEHTYLAWDFTVASTRSLSERMLHLRDDSFGQLGDAAPEFVVGEVTENPADDPIARSVRGVFNIPSYLDRPGGPPGAGFEYDENGLPRRTEGNKQIASFQCEIPRKALQDPAVPALYGHGLLGAEGEVGSGSITAMAAEHNLAFCATKWAGMSSDDLSFVAETLQDLGKFPAVPDRLQQGILNGLWLGRLLTHKDGFASDEAFRNDSGTSVLDADADLAYYGNSQGGIIGGALTAVSTEVERSALGVPGMNFSTLLNRSSNWAPFEQIVDTAYPDKLDQQVNLALIQMLWDRGETNGYAQHLTDDPLPGTPEHRVLMHVAFGDHQVSPTAAEVQARTVGARIHRPTVADGRNPDKEPYWAIEPLEYPAATGSAMVVWDSGAPYQPLTNTAPGEGADPHGDPRNDKAARAQTGEFLRTGRIVDVCSGAPCEAAPQG